MYFELKRADTVRDAFDVITQAMSKIIHRINAPFVAGVMVLGVTDSIQQRVAQPNVGRSHINPGAQRPRAIRKLARFHPREQIEIFLQAAIAPRAVFARAIRRATIRIRIRRRQIAHIRLALLDQVNRVFVKLIEIIRRIQRLERFEFVMSEPCNASNRKSFFPLASSVAGRSPLSVSSPTCHPPNRR
jgi:hypothetical protein